MKIVDEFYSRQEQQTLIINLKSQIIHLEHDSNKLRQSVEDITDENMHLRKLQEDLSQYMSKIFNQDLSQSLNFNLAKHPTVVEYTDENKEILALEKTKVEFF